MIHSKWFELIWSDWKRKKNKKLKGEYISFHNLDLSLDCRPWWYFGCLVCWGRGRGRGRGGRMWKLWLWMNRRPPETHSSGGTSVDSGWRHDSSEAFQPENNQKGSIWVDGRYEDACIGLGEFFVFFSGKSLKHCSCSHMIFLRFNFWFLLRSSSFFLKKRSKLRCRRAKL